MMIADFFARAGWDVTGSEAPAGADLFRLVRDQWFDVVGMAVGCDRRLELLAADIRTLRATSRNSDVQVMLGGPILAMHPEYVGVVGADGMAADARQALQMAERLVALAAAAPQNEAPTQGDGEVRC
jgi:methanogenic corrinoid protein MtbC1